MGLQVFCLRCEPLLFEWSGTVGAAPSRWGIQVGTVQISGVVDTLQQTRGGSIQGVVMSPKGSRPSVESDVRVVPASEASRDDLRAIFGTRGVGATCLCQRYKLERNESFGSVPVEVRWDRLIDQTDCGNGGERTSGLVGYLDDEAVGWCAVEPRPYYIGLVRTFRVPWDGRDEDRTDLSVWAVTCLFTRAGYRRQGVSRAMAKAAARFADERGASALEAYPSVSGGSLPEDLHIGTLKTFEDAGFREVHRPSKRRAVMRIDFER